MMNKTLPWLAGILCVQLLISSGVYFFQNSMHGDFQQKALIEFADTNIDKIQIEDGDAKVFLERNDGGWILPELDQLPVQKEKVESLISSVKKLKTTWPVSTSGNSHERFDVTDEKFRRKLTLYDGDEVQGSLLLGTSPGFKKSHIRTPDDDAVYALELNAYDIPSKGIDWIDRKILAIEDVSRIKGADYDITRQNGQWQFSEAKAEQEVGVAQDKVGDLTKALSSLRVSDVANDKHKFMGENSISLSVWGDKKLTYQLSESDNTYYIKRSDISTTFTLSKHEYERLVGAKHENIALKNSPLEENAQQEEDEENPTA